MGAGFHGGFSGTKGSAPVHSSHDVTYDKTKIAGYLLNENHPVGKAKAEFFKNVLGYTDQDSKLFHTKIVESISEKVPSKTEHTDFGLKHTFHVPLKGKTGTYVSAKVVVVIQKDKGKTHYKIVTVYPD